MIDKNKNLINMESRIKKQFIEPFYVKTTIRIKKKRTEEMKQGSKLKEEDFSWYSNSKINTQIMKLTWESLLTIALWLRIMRGELITSQVIIEIKRKAMKTIQKVLSLK